MKKQLSLSIVCLFLMAGLTFAQQSFSWSGGNTTADSGTYDSNDTFTLTLSGTFAGFTAIAFSTWLETNEALAPFLTITGASFAGATWTSANDAPEDYDPGFSPFPKAFTSSEASAGFLSSFNTMGISAAEPDPRTGDLGANGSGRTPNTYLLTSITFQLSGAPAGVYSLQTTTTGRQSIFTEQGSFDDMNVGATVFTLTVIPEPSTVGLAILGGAALLVGVWRKQRAQA